MESIDFIDLIESEKWIKQRLYRIYSIFVLDFSGKFQTSIKNIIFGHVYFVGSLKIMKNENYVKNDPKNRISDLWGLRGSLGNQISWRSDLPKFHLDQPRPKILIFWSFSFIFCYLGHDWCALGMADRLGYSKGLFPFHSPCPCPIGSCQGL